MFRLERWGGGDRRHLRLRVPLIRLQVEFHGYTHRYTTSPPREVWQFVFVYDHKPKEQP